MPILFISVGLVLLISIVFALFFVFRSAASSGSKPSSSVLSEERNALAQSQSNPSVQPPLNLSAPLSPASSNPNRFPPQQAGSHAHDHAFSGQRANHVTRNPRFAESSPSHYSVQSSPIASASPPFPGELTQHSPARRTQTRSELEQVYERGMQATYDVDIDAVHLILTNVVMKTPAEVAIAFDVCTRKIQEVLRWQGKERAALLVDIAGLVIGGDATTAWGQSLKACWDTICVVVGKDLYLAAHYNSKASSPNQEQLLEKVRRIQLMTSAVINDFQSNIFDTREEAIAFLRRMRELHAS